jgi:hypothetical protein
MGAGRISANPFVLSLSKDGRSPLVHKNVGWVERSDTHRSKSTPNGFDFDYIYR